MSPLENDSLRSGRGERTRNPAGADDAIVMVKEFVNQGNQDMNISTELDPLAGAPSPKAVPDLHWKRTLDALLILLALPFLVPLALLVALLIRSGSRGPILFRQERVGYQGRRFRCFKFRTMFVDADTTAHQGHLQDLMHSNAPMTKMDSRGDLRIIPFGLLLRASGLDELPQLINVLRGDMSLVGPRPCLPYECEHYLPWQKERFETVPGLTGLWQVSGKNKTTFVEMVQLDIKYAKNKTVWWDLKIILMTVPALIIQMLETRQSRKTSSRPVLRELASKIPGRVTPHSPLPLSSVVSQHE
jgi:lipopolysaccharide/colanic/teichoic acid biosynthesis glycosyltransferase